LDAAVALALVSGAAALVGVDVVAAATGGFAEADALGELFDPLEQAAHITIGKRTT
jgi:hypothetical protein